MSLNDYQAKYFAHELTYRFPPDSVEKVTAAFAGAQVDLNPHQIDAALFAFKSPLSRDALLADEVGLGKTIEAGLVLSQKWVERMLRILIITPSNLRKQWYQELTDKFFLPCRLLETKSYNAAFKQGALRLRPFEAPEIFICSFLSSHKPAVLCMRLYRNAKPASKKRYPSVTPAFLKPKPTNWTAGPMT